MSSSRRWSARDTPRHGRTEEGRPHWRAAAAAQVSLQAWRSAVLTLFESAYLETRAHTQTSTRLQMRLRGDRTWMRSTHGCACHRTTRRNTSQEGARYHDRARTGSTRDGKTAQKPARHRAPGTGGLVEFERARMGEARVCHNLSGGPAGAGRGRLSPAEKRAQHRTLRIVTTLYTLNSAAGELRVLVPLETAQCVSLGRWKAPRTRARCRWVVRDPAMSSAALRAHDFNRRDAGSCQSAGSPQNRTRPHFEVDIRARPTTNPPAARTENMATCRLRALLMAVMTAPACVRADRNPAAAARRGAHAFASSHVSAMPVRHLGRSAATSTAQGGAKAVGARMPPPSTPRAGAHAARARSILAARLAGADGPVPSSHVHLVGSGIGGVEHLTVQAKELLQRADAVVYDALADKELLGLTPPGCDHFYVGKRGGDGPGMPVQQGIDALLVQLATSGKASGT